MADDVQNPSADPEVAHPAAASEGAASDGGGAAPSWAILRQVVIATADHAADVAAVRSAFGFGEGFGDPELKDLALLDATMPVSGKRYLELIGPENDTAAVTKWLTKIGGRGGYVLSVQHPDPDAVRARALERGVRVPIDTTALGHTVIQLHPQDVGAAARGRRDRGRLRVVLGRHRPRPGTGRPGRRDRRRRGARGATRRR